MKFRPLPQTPLAILANKLFVKYYGIQCQTNCAMNDEDINKLLTGMAAPYIIADLAEDHLQHVNNSSIISKKSRFWFNLFKRHLSSTTRAGMTADEIATFCDICDKVQPAYEQIWMKAEIQIRNASYCLTTIDPNVREIIVSLEMLLLYCAESNDALFITTGHDSRAIHRAIDALKNCIREVFAKNVVDVDTEKYNSFTEQVNNCVKSFSNKLIETIGNP